MAKTDGDIVFKDEAVIKVLFLQKRDFELLSATELHLLRLLMLFENFQDCLRMANKTFKYFLKYCSSW